MNIPCENCNHKNVCENTFDPYYYSECEYYEETRPHGEWKPDGTCSECGVYSSLNKDATYFCPNCGAELKKGCDTNDQL